MFKVSKPWIPESLNPLTLGVEEGDKGGVEDGDKGSPEPLN